MKKYVLFLDLLTRFVSKRFSLSVKNWLYGILVRYHCFVGHTSTTHKCTAITFSPECRIILTHVRVSWLFRRFEFFLGEVKIGYGYIAKFLVTGVLYLTPSPMKKLSEKTIVILQRRLLTNLFESLKL